MTNNMDALPTRSLERTGRLARWFRSQDLRVRARRRDRAVDDAQRIGDIKWAWRQACEVTGLGRLVFTPSGQTVSIPLIGRVELGQPTTFTVRPLPGQLLADFEAAGPRIAAAMGVARTRVRPLAGEWFVVELLEGSAQPQRAAASQVIPLTPRGGPGHRVAA